MASHVSIFTKEGSPQRTSIAHGLFANIEQGQKVLFIEFMKNNDSFTTPSSKLHRLFFISNGVAWACSDAFVISSEATVDYLLFEISNYESDYDLVILDDIFLALNKKVIKESEVVFLLSLFNCHVVLTGANVPPSMLSYADSITYVNAVKENYQKQISAAVMGISW